MNNDAVVIDYTNYRGERAERHVIPQVIWYGTNEWHPDDQWLLDAIDIQKHETRSFAMASIHAWRPGPPMSSVIDSASGGTR